ncbi:hypothetical protein [Agrobacterium vitis]
MDNSDIGSAFDVPGIITGLRQDLAELRSGTITAHEAKVRAEIAKQIFSGLRLMVQAQKYMAGNAKPITQISEVAGDGR